jgi:hypothetical protein
MLYTHGLVPRSGVEIILFTEDNGWNAKKEKKQLENKMVAKATDRNMQNTPRLSNIYMPRASYHIAGMYFCQCWELISIGKAVKVFMEWGRLGGVLDKAG